VLSAAIHAQHHFANALYALSSWLQERKTLNDPKVSAINEQKAVSLLKDLFNGA
jgi:hypothetical protein